MNKLTKFVKKKEKIIKEKPVVNFMGGISYEINPLDTLKMVTASSIFGEPAYYRDGIEDGSAYINKFVEPYVVFDFTSKEKTSDVMLDAIKAALDYDFEATIRWAASLRNDFYMRLNPQIIMVKAATHPSRAEFSKNHPGVFNELNKEVMRRADEPAAQLSCYLYLNDSSKANIPSILKRSWADRIASMTAYEMAKYKNAEAGLINTIRVCHAKGKLVNELMTTGDVAVADEDTTWNVLRSEGKSWREILDTIKMPHMAALRNLRGIFQEIDDYDFAKKFLDELKAGVLKGKQFPFRYYNAYKMIQKMDEEKLHHKTLILDTLEECVDISLANMPKLKGKTICLSDNSGSAWGTINSEYGTVTIAEIDNLSAVVTGMNSDEGFIGKFGDKLVVEGISKKQGALAQAQEISNRGYSDVGAGTENGIWLFFKEAIENKVVYDNIFIYSDMQAGHGGLYGEGREYVVEGENFTCRSNYIDVMKLINKYRATVNPKANIFCVQTAGYDNVLIPEFTYRGAVLYGWTGKETMFANELIKQWDEIESRKTQKQTKETNEN